MSDQFDPADAGCWMARGRPAHHAAALAEAWQRYPDLPPDASPEARMARTRERVQMLRPLHDAISRETEQKRRLDNFAFVESKLAEGSPDLRYVAIIRARDQHGHDWDAAVAYADGWYAAHAGWVARPPALDRSDQPGARRMAYDQGFRAGGGQPDDLFDVARRAFSAPVVEPSVQAAPATARPRPSLWPMPNDAPAPVTWQRRLLIVGTSEVATATYGFLAMLRERPGHEAATIVVADPDQGLRLLPERSDRAVPPETPQLRDLLSRGDFTDILITAEGAELARVDAEADVLPLVRNMERTCNSALQQRAQFRIWLARGRAPGTQFAAGHIRWGKLAAGLSGRLGEFTVRYAGPAEPRGHRIVVEDATGGLARGYRMPDGRTLDPEIVISNKARSREAMAGLLREFAASIRLAA